MTEKFNACIHGATDQIMCRTWKSGFFCISVLLQTTNIAAADNQLIALAEKEIASIISQDRMPHFRQFTAMSVGNLQKIDPVVADNLPDFFQEQLEAQVPPEILQSSEKIIQVLKRHPCFLPYDEWGFLPVEGSPLDGPALNSLIEKISFNLALDADGATGRITSDEADLIRTDPMAFNRGLLHAYVQGQFPKLYQAVLIEEGCGAGEIVIAISNYDEFSSVNYITDFFFRICARRFSDPWNTAECPFWLSAQRDIAVSGRYRWQGVDTAGQYRFGAFQVIYDPASYQEFQLR